MTKLVDSDSNRVKRPITPGELEDGLLSTLAGDRDAELRLIEYFYTHITTHEPYDIATLERYMEEVFKQVITTANRGSDSPLLLRRKRGRPQKDNTEEDHRCFAVEVSVLMRKGSTWESACNDVADRFNTSERTVQRAFHTYRSGIAELSEAEFEGLLEDCKATANKCADLMD